MPIYEYRCNQGHTFEVRQRMTDDAVEICESCGAPVTKVLHSPAVHFKGSGFYNTDYGTRKRAREQKENSDSKSSESSGSSESKSDSKSDQSDSKKSDSATAKAA